MTILTFLSAQKTHIIYGLVIVGLLGVSYRLFVRKPETIVQTKVETKVVTIVQTKLVKVHDNIVTHKKIVTTKKDGTKIVETDSSVNKSVSDTSQKVSKSDTLSLTQQTVTSYAPNYTLSVLYPIPLTGVFSPTSYTAQNTEVILGKRLWGSPIFVNVGTNFGLNTVLAGVTLEL